RWIPLIDPSNDLISLLAVASVGMIVVVRGGAMVLASVCWPDRSTLLSRSISFEPFLAMVEGITVPRRCDDGRRGVERALATEVADATGVPWNMTRIQRIPMHTMHSTMHN